MSLFIMKRLFFILCAISTLLLLSACSSKHPQLPQQFETCDYLPAMYPDYSEVVLPCNLSSPNFLVDDPDVTEVVADVEYADDHMVFGCGTDVVFGLEDWRKISESSKGSALSLTLYTKRGEKGWLRHPSFHIMIAADSIDPWVSYRLIEPSYVSYERIDICRRSLQDDREELIASNRDSRKANKPQCINCHSFQASNPDNMLYHVRGAQGGTMLQYKGEKKFLTNLKRDGMMSNPVYPALHPTLPLIAFSTNLTGQLFHTHGQAKVEVQDSRSELVLYDVEADQMHKLASDSSQFDCFPTWSPDGKWLYYTSAHVSQPDSIVAKYQEVQYDLWRRPFYADSLCFGTPEKVLDSAAQEQSASLPRISPDGKYLLFASGRFGCFHIWHEDADILLLNLETMEVDSLAVLNSSKAESYPTWSSNGRWIFMASRRDDGNYSRIYISYFDKEGRAHKAFALPHANPAHDRMLLRSYNRPEPMPGE